MKIIFGLQKKDLPVVSLNPTLPNLLATEHSCINNTAIKTNLELFKDIFVVTVKLIPIIHATQNTK